MTAYSAHDKYSDWVEDASQYGSKQSESEHGRRVLEIADRFGVPVTSYNVTVRRDGSHTLTDGSYERLLTVVPGVSYSRPFTWHIDTVMTKSTGIPEVK